ncbi:MAG: alpha/beta hydrolase [Eubacteriales bacterium]|nr:alpha/beta hydrolase [Eubacteriales bacterium]MDD3881047.1 alpha/beta hydrolase [Eubacteriales bacterium]MDD4511884.1 alpha/beta hydrolase [Eubacteriales bacterium]
MKPVKLLTIAALVLALALPCAALASNATDTSAWTTETSDTASHAYPMGKGVIELFDSYTFETGVTRVGAMDYYLYDPIKHGAPADKEYPLIMMLHGSGNGGDNDKLCGALTDWMIYASSEYQSALSGAYILFPKANEYDTRRTKTVCDTEYLYKGTGDWMTSAKMTSVYSPALYALVQKLKAEYPISSLSVIGSSAGGYMAWRFAIDYPDLCDKIIPVAPAYAPSEKELKLLEDNGVGIWVVHGEKDANCPLKLFTGKIADRLEQMENARVSILDTVRFGDRRIVRIIVDGMDMGQHLAQFAVGQNMIYADGLPYDERYPDGIIAWLVE